MVVTGNEIGYIIVTHAEMDVEDIFGRSRENAGTMGMSADHMIPGSTMRRGEVTAMSERNPHLAPLATVITDIPVCPGGGPPLMATLGRHVSVRE